MLLQPALCKCRPRIRGTSLINQYNHGPREQLLPSWRCRSNELSAPAVFLDISTFMFPMDKTALEVKTVFSTRVENCSFSAMTMKNKCSENIMEIGDKSNFKASTQALKLPWRRLQQEKRKNTGEKTEKKEKISESVHLETLHVRRVYNQIAPHIQDLKQKTWPRVREFLKSLKPGSVVADIGCGNGRYLNINPSIIKIGSDICHSFLRTASANGFEVMSADNLKLPYRSDMFDAAISIGVIHHFASKERRVQAIGELVRIVCPGGLMMVYVWAFEQKYRKFDSQDILVPWNKPRKSDHCRRKPCVSSLSDVDCLSTSSTGSSVSDDDFTACPCHQLGHHEETCKNHLPDFKQHQQDTDRLMQASEKTSYLSSRKGLDRCSKFLGRTHSTEGMISQHEHQLARGEALIKECKKVESYLSSLCKHTWGSFPGTPKPLSSLLNCDNDTELLEDAVLNGSEKNSTSCQSLSLQDDEVFLDKTYSPVLDSPSHQSHKMFESTKSDFCRATFGSCSLLKLEAQQTADGSNVRKLHHKCPVFKGSLDSLETRASSIELDRPICITPRDKEDLVRLDIQNKRQIVGKCSTEDDYCIVDLEGEGTFPVKAVLSSSAHNEGLPKSVLTSLKQGLRSIFMKTKKKNGKHPSSSPCFVPCFVPSQPEGLFQIREFPQSSLPLGSCVHREIGCCLGASECTEQSDSNPAQLSVASERTSSECQKLCQSHVLCHESLQEEQVTFNSSHKPCGCIDDGKSHSANAAVLPVHNHEQGSSQDEQITCSHKSNTADAIFKTKHPESISRITGQNTADAVIKTEHAEFAQSTNSCVPFVGKKTYHASDISDDSLTPPASSKVDARNADLSRFYHVFREGELQDLITEHFPGVAVVDSFYDHANWCLIVKKL